VRGEKPEFLRDATVDFGKWQDRAQTNAGYEECGEANDRIGHTRDERFAPGRLGRN
jgi:hypothetical protein